MQTKINLFNSIILGTLLYGVSICGLWYDDLLERVQVGFLKEVPALPKTTKDYLVNSKMGFQNY